MASYLLLAVGGRGRGAERPVFRVEEHKRKVRSINGRVARPLLCLYMKNKGAICVEVHTNTLVLCPTLGLGWLIHLQTGISFPHSH